MSPTKGSSMIYSKVSIKGRIRKSTSPYESNPLGSPDQSDLWVRLDVLLQLALKWPILSAVCDKSGLKPTLQMFLNIVFPSLRLLLLLGKPEDEGRQQSKHRRPSQSVPAAVVETWDSIGSSMTSTSCENQVSAPV